MKKNDETINYIRMFQFICFQIFMIGYLDFVMPFYNWNFWFYLMNLSMLEYISLGFLVFWHKERLKGEKDDRQKLR